MENRTRRGSLKTYSRRKNRDRTFEAVFVEYAMQSVKQSIFSPDEKVPASDEVKRKRQNSTSILHGQGSLKRLKQDKNKKAALKVKIQRKPSQGLSSHVQDSDQEDVLFGENIHLVKTRKKTNGRRTVKDTTGPSSRRALRDKKGVKPGVPDSEGRSKKGSARKATVSASDSKTLFLDKTGSVMEPAPAVQDHVVSSDMKELPPVGQIRSEDKVSDWLARSNKSKSQHDSSKEIWREEQQFTGDEMRNRLFPDEFFSNLNKVLQRPKSHTVKADKNAQDRFLSQLALRSMDQPVASEPLTAEAENRMSCSDEEYVTFMYMDTQTETQTGTQTETGTSMFTADTATSKCTDTQTKVQTGTKSFTTGTATSRFTETQSEIQTGAQTVTGTKSIVADTATSRFSETHSEIQSETKTETGTESFTTDTVTSGHGLSRESKEQPTKVLSVRDHSINELPDTQTDRPEMPDSGRRKSKGIEQALGASDVEQTIICKDARVQKYLCSTMRRSGSTSNAFFPSELSSVTDSLKIQQKDENTPKRMAEDFKMPGSPVKNAVFKGVGRKGTLQPKNSTKLFTSGFVEIVDVIPQMSTIVNDPGSKISSPDKRSLQISFLEKKGTDGQQKQNIKTSTPNKVNFQGQPFQFEADISSVNIDSEDDDLLLFRESREINSDECVHLSDIMIDNQKDATLVDKVEFQTAKESEMISSFQNETVCSTARTSKGKDHFKYESFIGKKTKVKGKSPKTRRPVRKNALRIALPQKSLKDKSTHRRQSSCDTQTLKQSNIVDNTSTKMLTNNNELIGMINNIDQSPESQKEMLGKIAGSKCKNKTVKQTVLGIIKSPANVPSTKNCLYHKKDVYDIDESTNNLPNPHFQKQARKLSLFSLKSSGKKTIKEKKLKLQTLSKRTSSEILFKPEGLLDFTKTSQSTSYSSLFAGCKNGNNRVSDVERDGMVPICTLNQEFTCPKGSVSLIKFKTGDTRSRKEMLDSATIDVLQW